MELFPKTMNTFFKMPLQGEMKIVKISQNFRGSDKEKAKKT